MKDLLIIEPDPSQALAIRIALQVYFRNIWIAHDISEAIRALKTMSFHIILTEFSFPFMDGYIALEQILMVSGKAQLILITATPPELNLSRQAFLNIRAILEKPIDLEILKKHLFA